MYLKEKFNIDPASALSMRGAPHPTGHPHEALVHVRGDVTGK